jgi:hypothetical protein
MKALMPEKKLSKSPEDILVGGRAAFSYEDLWGRGSGPARTNILIEPFFWQFSTAAMG